MLAASIIEAATDKGLPAFSRLRSSKYIVVTTTEK